MRPVKNLPSLFPIMFSLPQNYDFQFFKVTPTKKWRFLKYKRHDTSSAFVYCFLIAMNKKLT